MAEARRAGLATLLPLTAETLAPQWETVLICNNAGRQRERVLRVEVEARSTETSQDDFLAKLAVSGTCGVWWNAGYVGPNDPAGAPDPWYGGAAMRVRYGSSPGIMRTLYADLRDGEFNLPPCELVEVAAGRWDRGPGSRDTATTLTIMAEVADGMSIESTPLICSAYKPINGPVDGGSSMGLCLCPPGAYAFEVTGGIIDQEAAEIGTGWRGGIVARGGSEFLERNWSTGKWCPPTSPRPLNAPYVTVWPAYPDHYVAEPDGPTPQWGAAIQFYVR